MEGKPKIFKTKSMPHGRWWNKGVKKYGSKKNALVANMPMTFM
ncbi:hypothetical protein P7250_11000 [Vibrio parahaemolyticus]|nr:hypothetical protein [Vibrio parahaemolyticus]